MRDFSDQPSLDDIAEQFASAIRSGETPSVASYLERYPDTTGELAKLLASIALIEGLKKQTLAAQPHSANLAAIAIEGYEMVREIGRGGMGVVFEAIQHALGRRVAIKVLAGNLIDGHQHLARFRTEARAAARLRHPHIVPVFGVGSTGDCHYYVMDFIEGQSLRQRLENQLRQTQAADNLASERYQRWVAEVGATVCDALSYAHCQGVLHRDIKPANLMIDQSDSVWIADFGLAKLSEPNALDQTALTRTGEVIGTPQYMPPESFDGLYDERSEIYSVGLTLYEMLTGRPAIQGRNTAETIRQALAGVTAAPRKFNSTVPTDLDTIVLKALSVDTKSRYPSAAAMRDDLECFLNYRPIQARRLGMAERTIRWCRREPLIATLTVCTIALLGALACVSGIGYLQTKRAFENEQWLSLEAVTARNEAEAALESKSNALEIADQQKALAEQNLQTALSAFNEIMANVTSRSLQVDDELLGEVIDTTAANVSPEDAKLLGTLLVFFDELAENNSQELLAEAAAAAKNAGDIYLSLGELKQADQAYSKASQRFQRLRKLEPNTSQNIAAYAEVLNSLALVSGLRGQLPRAQSLFYDVCELMEFSTSVADSEAQFEFAKAHRLVATIRSRIGLDAPPLERARVAPRFQGALRKAKARNQLDLADIATAINLLRALVEQAPGNERYLSELARGYRSQAELLSQCSNSSAEEDAEQALLSSIEIFEQLLSENENSNTLRYELALSLVGGVGTGVLQSERTTRAAELCQQLLDATPGLPRYQVLQARTLKATGDIKAADNNLASAEADYWRVVRIYGSLLKQTPEVRLYQVRRSQTLETIAGLKLAQGKTAEARELFERTIHRLQLSPRLGENSPAVRLLIERIQHKSEQLEQTSSP